MTAGGKNMKPFKTFLYETSFYYLLAIFWLPLVYAVTYHLSFMEMYSLDWFRASLIFSPVILFVACIRYFFIKRREMRTKYVPRN